MHPLILTAVFALGICTAAAAPATPPPWQSQALNRLASVQTEELPPLILSENGQAKADIVCPDQPYYRQIANLLKQYLDQACAANFAIITQQQPGRQAIFVGPSEHPQVQAACARAQTLPLETLLVESIADGIILTGRDADSPNRLKPKGRLDIGDRHQSRGTFFAAVDFLERMIGCRFYFAGIGVHVPDYAGQSVPVPPLSYADAPAFPFRALGYVGGSDFAKLKTTPGDATRINDLLRLGDVNQLTAWHTDSRWHEVYGQTHPEFFARRDDGSRAIGDRGRFSAYRCYSEPAGKQAHLDAINAWYAADGSDPTLATLFLANQREFGPNRRYIHWGIADAFRGCFCPACLALTDRQTPGGLYSGFVWRYLIDLARECKNRWPDKIVVSMLYGQYRTIPAWVAQENPGNLLIYTTSHGTLGQSAAFLKEPLVRADALRTIRQTRALSAEKTLIWEHYPHVPRASGFTIPYMIPHVYRDFFLEIRDEVAGSLFNGDPRYSYAMDALMLYMMYKIHWNPDFDVDACLHEFCTHLFGPAADDLRDYYQTLVDRWENLLWKDLPDPTRINYAALPRNFFWEESYPRPVRDRLEQTLQRAADKIPSGTLFRDRIDLMLAGTAPFFRQGRLYDRGLVYHYLCRPLTTAPQPHPEPDTEAEVIRLADNATGDVSDEVRAAIQIFHDAENICIIGSIRQNIPLKTQGGGQALPRDSDIWAANSLEIFLSTAQPGLTEAGFDQREQYHQIIIDPDGNILDGVKEVNHTINLGATLDLQLEVLPATPETFRFKLSIPFRTLHCLPPRAGQPWYVNFYWNTPQRGKGASFTWAGTGAHHDPGRFGTLEFRSE